MKNFFLKSIFAASLIFFCSAQSQAEVPYDSLEKIRQFLIVKKVSVDLKEGKRIKSCPETELHADLETKLAAAFKNEYVVWDNAQILVADLKLLKARVRNCRKRASCEIYVEFLARAVKEQASANEVQNLLAEAKKLSNQIQPTDYLNALSSVPEKCQALKSLLEFVAS